MHSVDACACANVDGLHVEVHVGLGLRVGLSVELGLVYITGNSIVPSRILTRSQTGRQADRQTLVSLCNFVSVSGENCVPNQPVVYMSSALLRNPWNRYTWYTRYIVCVDNLFVV